MLKAVEQKIAQLGWLGANGRTDYSLVPEPHREWLISQPEIVRGDYSYRIATDGAVLTASGETPIRSAHRERQVIARYLEWNAQTFPEYARLINTLIEQPKNSTARDGIAGTTEIGRRDISPMDSQCQYAVFIPARYEANGIRRTLTQFAQQVDEYGQSLNPRTWEINVLVNFRDGEKPDATYDKVVAFKREYPQIRCNVIEVKLQGPWAHAGMARKLVSDVTLVRAMQRGNRYTKPLYLESQDADLLKVDDQQVSKSLSLLESRPELDAVVGHTEMTPEEMVQNDLVFLSRRFWDFARVQTNKYIHLIPPGKRNFHSTRVWTFGTSTAVSAEAFALIGGYDWDTGVGEDLDIGKRISLLRGREIKGRFVPNLATVESSQTRTNSSPRRYYWGAFEENGSEYDHFDDQTVRQMSLTELQENAPYQRISPQNVKRFEKMFYHAYESLRFILPDQKLARKVMRRTLIYLGFQPGDFEFVNGSKIKLTSVESVARVLEENRQRVLKTKAQPETTRTSAEIYLADRDERRRIADQLMRSRAPMSDMLRAFGNDYTALENYYRRITGTELVRDPARSLEVDIPITKSVSVIIPVFNKVDDVSYSVEALAMSSFAQKYPTQFEVVVVDDGSTQGDVLGALQQAKIDGGGINMRVIRQPNSGKVGALYTGIQMAKGDVVVTIDPDYLPLPQTIEELMKRHEVLDDVLLLGFRSDVERAQLTEQGVAQVLTTSQPRFADDVRFIGDNNFAETKWLKASGFDRPIFDGHVRMRTSSFAHEVVRSAPREAMLKAMGGYVPDVTYNPGDEILCHRLQAQGLYVIPVPSATGLHIAHVSNYNAERSKKRRDLMRALYKEPFPETAINPYYLVAQVAHEQTASRSVGSQTGTRNKSMRAADVGSMYLEAGLEKEAVIYLEKAVLVDPTSPRVHASLALVRLSTGDITGAKKALAEALKHGKNHPMVIAVQGALLAQLGDFTSAQAYIAQAAQSTDVQAVKLARSYLNGDGKNQVAEARRYLDEAKEQSGRKKRAIQSLRKALIENPNNREARELLDRLSR